MPLGWGLRPTPAWLDLDQFPVLGAEGGHAFLHLIGVWVGAHVLVKNGHRGTFGFSLQSYSIGYFVSSYVQMQITLVGSSYHIF